MHPSSTSSPEQPAQAATLHHKVKGQMAKQEAFSRVAPVLRTALLMGVCGGFALATVLTVTEALAIPEGAWWEASAQAHGHLQLFGWAGLFVLGVALHFLPRLRGAPLAHARLIPWLLALLTGGLILRAVGQVLLTVQHIIVWRVLLVVSGIFEAGALLGIIALLLLTALSGPRAQSRPAYWGVLPLLVGAFAALAVASINNLLNMFQAATGAGLVLPASDTLNITLGLFGFLVPMALAMSARSLPMYAGLEAFPQRLLWPAAAAYFLGLVCFCLSLNSALAPLAVQLFGGLGLLTMGTTVLLFISVFMRMMRKRGKLPQKVAQLSPAPAQLAQSYRRQVQSEQANYGPFVALVASAYLWAMLGSLLLLVDGGLQLVGLDTPFALDAVRHSFAIGFIALLICGIGPRMLPGFSGGHIASAGLVTATLWLGNLAAALRVGSILLSPWLANMHIGNLALLLFGLSGPLGLALALCLAINLWPALKTKP
jgi:uncharacterized protein involved in response to NO